MRPSGLPLPRASAIPQVMSRVPQTPADLYVGRRGPPLLLICSVISTLMDQTSPAQSLHPPRFLKFPPLFTTFHPLPQVPEPYIPVLLFPHLNLSSRREAAPWGTRSLCTVSSRPPHVPLTAKLGSANRRRALGRRACTRESGVHAGVGRADGRWACTREVGVHAGAGRALESRACTRESGVHWRAGRARGSRACTREPGVHAGAGCALESPACTRESGVHTRAGHAHGSRACTREPGVHWRAGCARRSRACKGEGRACTREPGVLLSYVRVTL